MLILPSPIKRFGTGGRPTTLSEVRHAWPGLSLRIASEKISQPTDWTINDACHNVIVHLGGRMDLLETELDGKGSSFGPAVTGEVWCVPAGRRYASFAVGTTIHYAVFSLPVIHSSLGADKGRKPEILPAAGHLNERLLSHANELIQLASKDDDLSQLGAESLVSSVVDAIEKAYCDHRSTEVATRRQSPELSSNQARALREYLFDRLAEPLTLQQLASVVGMSSHSLLIAFRLAFGTTPAQYILTQRLRRAQWLLLHSRKEITEIALAAGFASHSHLTTSFTKRFGYPPRDFRLRHA